MLQRDFELANRIILALPLQRSNGSSLILSRSFSNVGELSTDRMGASIDSTSSIAASFLSCGPWRMDAPSKLAQSASRV